MNTLAWADISLSALNHNLAIAKAAAPHAKMMSVIKANAYGHGAIEAAKALDACEAFAVARIEEAVQLRQGGIEKDIIVLSGIGNKSDLDHCREHNLQAVIHNACMLDIALQPTPTPLNIWLKIDTGMHRLGLDPATFTAQLNRVNAALHIHLAGVMSHLASAELPDCISNLMQHDLFNQLTTETPNRSLANSAGILFHPSMHHEWTRPGIMLYGCNPSELNNTFTKQLQPVMTLKSRIISLKTIKSGEKVGYNGIWEAKKDSDIATIAIGYADGYPRHAGSGTPVLINGKTYPLAGRVSMDLITVDVSSSDNVSIGDEVTLWGEGLPANIIARHAQTIAYELFTGVTSRVKRNYL